jgi:hypothetical protein
MIFEATHPSIPQFVNGALSHEDHYKRNIGYEDGDGSSQK